ncbi:hydroxymethylbilane synthase [Paenibacillus sp. SEL3]|jgi:hydroxymethylbilane synthase|uniref:hydroxymethylbilane synthase n=1 Tax=Paenibacillus TaxID=44249 RepID=UPI00041FAEF0|nr:MULTISPECIES: hydroxymethylbilane synthase [Paenibacillus]KEO77811.1 porphobilinogen deaminase [Paenibacillus polymyxa]MBO3285893.1 hydroxymethylbilane synthase [Paenibacillus polymyxa]MCH6188920.1 hydroxymethylbilane synthase [Paenibacillus polymyxa]ODB55953.1 hydroxymethylbilane synthase [Paenibacillus polymyxa]UMY53748.1 hydroxymethylbilane synthase [Paenibacillus peoriae]
MRTIVVGSRQSALALTQTGHVIEDLNALCAEHGMDLQFVVKKILTKGDRILDVTLSKVGGKGLFVKEIEQAMLAGEIDMAVHSMKDMPSELPEGLVNGAVPRREDPRDCLITLGAESLEELPQGAKVGTSSLRRASQIKSMRPDLQLEPVRGNIDSRLKKLETEGFDAIILAAAGLHRMGWKDRITSYIPEEDCLPAVGQGALGIECRASDEELLALLRLYNDRDTSATVAAERTFLGVLNGGCQVPIGAHAVWAGQEISLTGMVGSPDGEVILKETLQGNDPQKLGEAVAASLIAKGAEQILAQVRG